ncbi:restriction system protein [uncultured Gammaproteobacteria bacterium]
MADGAILSRLREWLVRVFAQSIEKVTNEGDRQEIAKWLSDSRDLLNSDKTHSEKIKALYYLTDMKSAVRVVGNSVTETVKSYKNSNLPLSVKIAVPVTLLAAPFIGGQGAGIAALGGALGLPVLLLVFLGAAGISSILETMVTNRDAAPYLIGILEIIARDEIARRTSAALKTAMRTDPIDSRRFPMPSDEVKLRQKLLAMDPFDFESHIVSFFKTDGVKAWTTKKSNDLGVDGFVDHPDGLIVIQCKRHATNNPVGSPLVQQFKGVIEENGASKGYLVTTSNFTSGAIESAGKFDKLILVNIDELVHWHASSPMSSQV